VSSYGSPRSAGLSGPRSSTPKQDWSIDRCAIMTANRFAATLLLTAAVVAAPAGQSDDILRGTIDIHVHSDPDNVPRSIDGIDAAKVARSKGMRGIVLKNHYDPTAGLAFLARKEAPG